ncbi:hypothetical protein GUJ93_ZPchr0015g6608 [Zizania palustris]|uniref:Uncharacterized protein n=1 Tax=Zizania palustris TaxID=103762 RepID=A0A8J5TB83_ZIZPA|nr:hypothetical protein GUJ93_ZPchr0015g6608 [Zizania palustris]
MGNYGQHPNNLSNLRALSEVTGINYSDVFAENSHSQFAIAFHIIIPQLVVYAFATPPLVLRSPLTVAGDLLRPRRPHLRDRQDHANLGHPSVDAEHRWIAVADKYPNHLAVYPRRRPRPVDLSPCLRVMVVSVYMVGSGCKLGHWSMPVYQVHSYCRHYEGFVMELRMMLTFLGFLFEHEFQGVYLEEFVGPCDVSLTVHGSGEHLPLYTTALGGPTFDVACQRVALQALMELRMIYDDRLQNSSFRLVPKRTPGAYRSIYHGVHSVRDPVMA